jgi:hypothetical protein
MPTIYYFVRFPIWKFLNQPVFEASHKTVLNPQRFWHQYKIEMLERCFEMSSKSKDLRRDERCE